MASQRYRGASTVATPAARNARATSARACFPLPTKVRTPAGYPSAARLPGRGLDTRCLAVGPAARLPERDRVDRDEAARGLPDRNPTRI